MLGRGAFGALMMCMTGQRGPQTLGGTDKAIGRGRCETLQTFFRSPP